jgi:hypothetical protein
MYWSLCFAGADDLKKIFRQFAGRLERLERRVIDNITLPALSREEAANILRSELKDVAPHLDKILIQQQIDAATITVTVEGKRERYISIGRLMAAAREARESLTSDAPAQKVEAIA